jgi:hypothetical protein
MRTLLAVVVLVVGARAAAAQPGVTQSYPPPAYAYQPRQITITTEEQDLLDRGEITDGQQIGGGLAALFFGLGVGQAVEGRWRDTGWIFSFGEPLAIGVAIAGMVDSVERCPLDGRCNRPSSRATTMILGGLLAFTGLHVWEVVDAFVAPARHNRKLRALRERLGYPPPGQYILRPYLAPAGGQGGVAGLSIGF